MKTGSIRKKRIAIAAILTVGAVSFFTMVLAFVSQYINLQDVEQQHHIGMETVNDMLQPYLEQNLQELLEADSERYERALESVQGRLYDVGTASRLRRIYVVRHKADNSIIYVADGNLRETADSITIGNAVPKELYGYFAGVLSDKPNVAKQQPEVNYDGERSYVECRPLEDEDGTVCAALCMEASLEGYYKRNETNMVRFIAFGILAGFISLLIVRFAYIRETQIVEERLEETQSNLTFERTIFRDAMMNKALFAVAFDLTEGVIQEKDIMRQPQFLSNNVMVHFPVDFDDLTGYVRNIRRMSSGDEGLYTKQELLDAFESGKSSLTDEFFGIKNRQYYESTVLLSKNEQTQHVYACIMVSDITQEKQQEISYRENLQEANRRAQQQLDTISNFMPGGFKISTYDNAHRFVFVSPSLAAMFGYSVYEFMLATRGNVVDWVVTEDRDQAQAAYEVGMKKDGTYEAKYRVYCKDGTTRWVSDHGKRVMENDGTIQVYSVVLDIDEKERQAILLQDMNYILDIERDQYRNAMLQDANFSIVFNLTKGYVDEVRMFDGTNLLEKRNIPAPIHFNDLLWSAFDLGRYEMLDGKSKREVSVQELLRTYNEGQRMQEFDFYDPKYDRYDRMTVLMREEKNTGNVIALVLGRNITEQRKEADRKRIELENAYEEARRANLAKSDFLSRMSHDIRTPINGIMGMLEIIRKSREDEARVGDCLTKIQSSSEHLLSLINNVLDMSKLESGNTVIDKKPFDLKKELDKIQDIVSDQPLEHGLHYTYESENIEPFRYLLGSPLHLQQILLNLFSNALKYNKPGGSIDMRTSVENLGDNRVLFRASVRDTGIGMSREFVENKLFEPFEQAESSSRTQFKGTGLGMTIVKEIVEKMRGTITVDSTEGEGSTFRVCIPFEIDQTAASSKETRETEGDIRGMKLLVVEDNELNIEIVKFLLEEAGAIVTLCENGKEAVDTFAASPVNGFDAIMMDIMMPVMDGLEATRQIRAMKREDAGLIPIIAMTANAFAEDVAMAKQAGMNDHLSKPLRMEQMLVTVAKYRKAK